MNDRQRLKNLRALGGLLVGGDKLTLLESPTVTWRSVYQGADRTAAELHMRAAGQVPAERLEVRA